MKNLQLKTHYLLRILPVTIFLIIIVTTFSACQTKSKSNTSQDVTTIPQITSPIPTSPESEPNLGSSEITPSIINTSGNTIGTRFQLPAGYTRLESDSSDFSRFLSSLTLKPAGSEVLLYDGSPKPNQDSHVAIFDLDIGDRDLQQCADSAIRIYAEYYWSIGEYDKIAFHLTNGFLMEYTKWREGMRLVVDGNDVSWSKKKTYDDSYEEFRNYLNMVFAYAGTLSLSQESSTISINEALPGDMFLEGGSPGHCIMIVDVAVDGNGNKCFLLAQGYMPAQEFHIIKNPLHEDDPWYYTNEITYPFETPSWSFGDNSLVRWNSLALNSSQSSLTADDTSSLTLLAVGDNLIHIQVIESGEQADGTYNYDHLYTNLKQEISEADIAVINQETILGGDQFPYSGYPNFNSPEEIGDAVIKAGFDVVLQATNHTMDMGLNGVLNTFDFWDKHPEITVLGINKSEEEREQIKIVEKNGIKLAMLNYTFSLNGYTVPKDMPYLVNMLDKEKMAADIEKAEQLADFTIVFPHWGTEYVYEPTNAQENLTSFFYEQGVDLIIGTHPHVLEPVEWIEDNSDHRMLVYYSLGNFISYQREAPRMLGGIANVTITKDDGGTYISDSSITPIVTHYENGPADYHYALYELDDYSEALAKVHGVSDLAQNGPITYQDTLELANEVLGSWYPPEE
jgi:poly-gamma-glutamate synthesis protein (capsule biosynthesis protein)